MQHNKWEWEPSRCNTTLKKYGEKWNNVNQSTKNINSHNVR